jgi:hypothetical protein
VKFTRPPPFDHPSNPAQGIKLLYSMNAAGTRSRDPTADPSSSYFVDAAHQYATAAATALTSHRAKSKWSHLSSIPVPSKCVCVYTCVLVL